jgi:hypothetical protein
VHRNVVAAHAAQQHRHCHVGEVTVASKAGKKIRASVEAFETLNQFLGRARQRNDMFTTQFHSLFRVGSFAALQVELWPFSCNDFSGAYHRWNELCRYSFSEYREFVSGPCFEVLGPSSVSVPGEVLKVGIRAKAPTFPTLVVFRSS